MKKPNLKQQYRVNEQIRGVREVRIVGDDIASSVVSVSQALQIADQMGVDLVEISPNAEPPVCRLISRLLGILTDGPDISGINECCAVYLPEQF